MFELEELEQLPNNIQPFIADNNVFSMYFVLSILSLFLYSIVVLTSKQRMYHQFFNIFYSEQNTYKFYLSLPTQTSTQTFFLYIFSAIQIAYITPISLVEDGIINLLLKSLVLLVIFFTKEIIYKSLKQLLSNKIDVGYFLYNYQNIILYTCLTTFFIIILKNNFEIVNQNKNLIFILGVLIFYVLLAIRLFMIGIRFKFIRSIYFFLYLCALEIVPILLGMKIVDIL